MDASIASAVANVEDLLAERGLAGMDAPRRRPLAPLGRREYRGVKVVVT
jgi:hypothetical protein